MSVVYKFLFPAKPVGNAFSLFLLALRILFGVLLLSHGIQKWTNFSVMSESFPDPLGVGSTLSLGLAVFGEVFCIGRKSCFIAFLQFTRLVNNPIGCSVCVGSEAVGFVSHDKLSVEYLNGIE